ncbi:MAG: restriction endonuclease subunit S [Moorea sp. SIO1G6]|uniref:restriction endonuclease subunit S n=1 Tax=Moorena sp. SIO1G6 TaxID=2607840 RepID=UPI0013C14888|nr:restriction endonuclease subunit S [Moorena sp. SIO1G6]NET62976.1 restriction endonuclease subunit S [Moorena sp. SIO1G6]
MNKAQSPVGWVRSKLGKVAKIERESVKPENIQVGTTYIGLEHIDGEGMFSGVRSVDTGDIASNKFAFDSRHLLYGKLRPYLKKIARPNFNGICSTDILPILPGAHIDRSFLYYYLRQPQYIELATTRSTGANLPRLSPKTLAEFPILFPPLEEQKRIAAILDKADSIRRKRKKAIALTEELLRSTFLDMFGDPVTNPKGWEIVKLGSQIEELKYGTNSKCSTLQRKKDIPVLRIPNIVGDKLSWNELKYTNLESKEISKLILKNDDLLFVRSNGNPEYIGRCALFEGNGKQAVYASYLIRARIKPDAQLYPGFIRDIISFPSFRSRLVREARTTAGNYNINIQGLSRLKLICPPMDNQKRYLTFNQTVSEHIVKQQKKLENSENLFNSLLQKAFRGEL